MKLSVIIPVYNEEQTIYELIHQVNNQKKNIILEIIVVDDFSSDETRQILNKLKEQNLIDHLIFLDKNYGKGYAIRVGLKKCVGKVVIIQDADLEYDPSDYNNMLSIMDNKKIQCLYGSRVLGKKRYQQTNFLSGFRIFGNHFLTILTNLIYSQKLTDAHTCYKMLDTDLMKSLILRENRFSFCPELTSKISKKGIKIYECPISYNGRSYDEGKKITFVDGLAAIWVLIKYRFYN